MDQNLHISQALNHIDRILAYYPMIQEGAEATVWLTFEDWQVLYDLLFRTPDAREHLPEQITGFAMQEGAAAIVLQTENCRIRVEMTG